MFNINGSFKDAIESLRKKGTEELFWHEEADRLEVFKEIFYNKTNRCSFGACLNVRMPSLDAAGNAKQTLRITC